MTDLPPNAIAVGTRECLHPGNTAATCADCGLPVYFRDVTPLQVATKICVECWLVKLTDGTAYEYRLTPENFAFLRGLLVPERGGPPS